MSKAVRFWLIISLVLNISSAAVSAAEDTPPRARILITELQTEGPGTPPVLTEEFIELTNVSEETIDLTGWELQTKSASSPTAAWTKLLILSGVLYPKGSLLASHSGYLEGVAALHFGASISSTGGHIRLVDPLEPDKAEDKLGWGATANDADGAAALKPTAGMTLSRKSDQGVFIDTNDNASDFVLDVATPNTLNQEPLEEDTPPEVLPGTEELPETEGTPEEESGTETEEENLPTNEEQTGEEQVPEANPQTETEEPPLPSGASSTLEPIITEVFPDPVAPATDAEDEFIELFNPNESELLLDGYKLQTGSTFSYSYSLDGVVIPPRSYVSLRAADTNLVLSNSGGASRLVSKSGSYVSLVSYAKATAGQSYAMSDTGEWKWTTTLTPSDINIFTVIPDEVPVLKAAAAKVSKTTAPKSTTVKSATTKTAASKAAAKTATKKTTQKTESERQVFEDPVALNGDPPVHPVVLAGVGVVAVLYAAYEYREDIRNRLFRLRSYARARVSSR